MSLLIVLVFLIGAVLGMRFKVFILVPAIGSTLAAIVAGGVAYGTNVPVILATAVLAATSLQIGYLGGLATRHSMAVARSGRLRKVLQRVEPAR